MSDIYQPSLKNNTYWMFPVGFKDRDAIRSEVYTYKLWLNKYAHKVQSQLKMLSEEMTHLVTMVVLLHKDEHLDILRNLLEFCLSDKCFGDKLGKVFLHMNLLFRYCASN